LVWAAALAALALALGAHQVCIHQHVVPIVGHEGDMPHLTRRVHGERVRVRVVELVVILPGRFHPQYFLTRTGVTQVNISQYGPIPRWKRPAHRPEQPEDVPRGVVLVRPHQRHLRRVELVAGLFA
jgi:hypothetical protein